MTAIITQSGGAKQSPTLHSPNSPHVYLATRKHDVVAGSTVTGVTTRQTDTHGRTVAGIGLLILATLLYLATLDTGLQPHELHGGDLITHQYAQVQARPGNAPGYPLYTMGGWLWFHSIRRLAISLGSPHPNPLPILSSYSTLWALLSLWLLYHVLWKTTTSPQKPRGNWPIAFLVTAFYAVTYFFWYYATTTEQYSSAIAHTLAIFYVYLLWRETPQNNVLLYLLAFLSGLSLAHMLTVAFIVPPLTLVVIWQRPRLIRTPRTVLLSFLFAALPLLSYLYVYTRGAQHPEWWGAGAWTNASNWFWSFISTAQGREELLWGFEPGRAFLGNGFPQLILGELTIPLLLAGLVGIALLDRQTASLLYATLAIYLVFSWAYRYGNWFQVILPTYPLLLIGVSALADRWQRHFQLISTADHSSAALRALSYLPHLLLAIAIGWRAGGSFPEANSRNRPTDTALHRAAILLDQPIPQGAGLFAVVDDALALQYLSEIWQVRPDINVISSAQAAERLASTGQVFATWQSAPALISEMPDQLSINLQGFGVDWVVLSANPPAADSAVPAPLALPQSASVYPVTDGLTLVGYTVQPAPKGLPVNRSSSPAVDVVLYWRLDNGRWPDDLAVSLRPTRQGAFTTDAQGNITQVDRNHPIHGLFLPQDRTSQIVVADGYRLPLTNALHADIDGIAIIAYESAPDGYTDVANLQLPITQ